MKNFTKWFRLFFDGIMLKDKSYGMNIKHPSETDVFTSPPMKHKILSFFWGLCESFFLECTQLYFPLPTGSQILSALMLLLLLPDPQGNAQLSTLFIDVAAFLESNDARISWHHHYIISNYSINQQWVLWLTISLGFSYSLRIGNGNSSFLVCWT